MGRLWNILVKLRMAVELKSFMPIARRYFVIGAFDGALTILGVILGAYAIGELSSHLVIVAGTAAGIGLAISSAVGAYEIERIESGLSHMELERAMLITVQGSRKEVAAISNITIALVHGIAPLVAAYVPIIPFLIMEAEEAMIYAIVLTLGFLFVMGLYLGSLLKEKILYTGLRFVTAGLATGIIVFLLGGE